MPETVDVGTQSLDSYESSTGAEVVAEARALADRREDFVLQDF